MLAGLKRRAAALKADTLALYFAARHPDTPWRPKLLVAVIVAYALSPIDLIPDFIPVLGLLDELILLPLGIMLAIRLIPQAVLDECRRQARQRAQDGRPVSVAAGVVIVAIWVVAAAPTAAWVWRVLQA